MDNNQIHDNKINVENDIEVDIIDCSNCSSNCLCPWFKPKVKKVNGVRLCDVCSRLL